MTERWRKKLGDIDGASPSDDVYARAQDGPQQPDPMVPMPSTSNRVVTGIAAFLVFALAISVFAIPALRMNGPAGPGSRQILPLWPERSLDDLEALQAAADSGDADAAWVTDPAQVAISFGQEVLGWQSIDLSADPRCYDVGYCEGNTVVAVGPTPIDACSPYGLPNGGTGYMCSDSAVGAPGDLFDGYTSATYGPTGGPTIGAPDPFRSYTLRNEEPCECRRSSVTVRLYQPLDRGEGKLWAVLGAASEGSVLDVATGEALEDGYRIHARLRTIGTTAPTLAYAAGPGSCAAVGFTGESNLSMDLSTDFLTLDLQADCTSDSPGYIWAAQTWKPTIGSGDVLDPLTEGAYGDGAFEFVAVSVTFLAAQASDAFTGPPGTTLETTPPTLPTPDAWTTIPDDGQGYAIEVPGGAARRPVDNGVSYGIGDGLWVTIIRIGAPAADDSTFPLDPDRLAGSFPDFPVDWTFRGDGEAFEFFVSSEAGGQIELTDAQRRTVDRMLTSISFEPWQVGETRGQWTAIGEVLPNSTAEWVLFDGERFFASHVGEGRAMFGPVPGCTDGEGGYEVSEGSTVRVTCPDGTGGEWNLAGVAQIGNSPRFDVNLDVLPAVRSWDGLLLASFARP